MITTTTIVGRRPLTEEQIRKMRDDICTDQVIILIYLCTLLVFSLGRLAAILLQ